MTVPTVAHSSFRFETHAVNLSAKVLLEADVAAIMMITLGACLSSYFEILSALTLTSVVTGEKL